MRSPQVLHLFAAAAICAVPAGAQNRVVLRGHTHPLAQDRYDRGGAPAGLPLERIMLVLKRTPEQQQEVDGLLESLHDSSSPEFHRWLTPGEFGRRFGITDADLQSVQSWLLSQGFQIDNVGQGRTIVEFSGTAATVERAFRTSIHRYSVNGEDHWANRSDPQIPESLAPVVAGIAGLHDFHSRPQLKAQTDLGSGRHGLSPADYATIYNIRPLYQSGITGMGSTIAVAGRTNINVQDVADFRSFFGLPANSPQVIVNGADPGIVSTGEQMEAVLDATWAGAVAPGAAVQLVVSKSTNTSDGVLLSELYIIEQNRADILSISFGACEAANRGAAAAISAMAQQAAAQGISVVVASGDSGSAGCDSGSAATATGGLSVNVLASNPYTTAVGGTQFTDAPSKYWSAANGGGYVSALSYIPENVWNESGAPAGLWASGGGASAIYAKPAWQSGVVGIPTDGKRDLPDVSLTAASHDGYLVCMLGSCRSGGLYMVGGTSASAPAFAGMLALVRQTVKARLGIANTVLYRLAAGQNNAGIFNDVTSGTNAVPGASGYAAGAGYDLATGLGSVNAYNLATKWSTVAFSPTAIALTVNPKSFAAGAAATVSVVVTPKSGSGKPSGTVTLVASTGQTIGTYALGGGTAVVNESGFPIGTYTVIARYAGDGAYAPSDSAPVPITVTGVAKAVLSPSSKDFDAIAIGASSTAVLVLSNPGNATLTGIAISLVGANASEFGGFTNCSTTLAAGASCTITLSFRPSVPGTRNARLIVAGSATLSISASLTGTGVVPVR
jgi:subtilase family serine protease